MLLDADPLLDAANLARICGVVREGRDQSKAVLDRGLDDVAVAYARQSTSQYIGDPSYID